MGASSIEWTNETWNPVRGCTKVSAGCKHCYAETFAERWRGVPGHAYEQGFDLRLVPHKLDEPLRWKEPRRVFVNSMSDLFHEDVPNEYIAAVFGVMAAAPRHTFQILTKRAERLPKWFAWMNQQTAARDKWVKDVEEAERLSGDASGSRGAHLTAVESVAAIHHAIAQIGDVAQRRRVPYRVNSPWPLPNVWLGVSVEDQPRADERVPPLLCTPAAVRFLSCEPLLGRVDLTRIVLKASDAPERGKPPLSIDCLHGRHGGHEADRTHIDWVIIGAESGHGARPFRLEWARDLVNQCTDAGVAAFVKQLGARPQFAPETGPLVTLKLAKKGGDPSLWPGGAAAWPRQFPRSAP